MSFRRRKLDNWIKSFLGRKGILPVVDAAWMQAQGPAHNPVSDFWGGDFIRELKGPNPETLLSAVPDGETRLLFSLSVDWFNPFHNKIAGKSVSTGVLFMSCLNLPPEERYRDENIYLVGVMPGKRQISRLDAILQPLISDLLRYWHEGVYFTGIPDVHGARLVRCALMQLICDLPAARKLAGFPGHSAKYNCSACVASRDNMADVSSVDDPSLQRTRECHMRHASEYKAVLETSGYKAAEKLRNSSPEGVRWSILNNLPYWDPIKCTVIDCMHLILLGLCQFHWRKFWNADTLKSNAPRTSDPPDADNADWLDDGDSMIPTANLYEDHFHTEEAISEQPRHKPLPLKEVQEARNCWLYGTDAGLKRLNTQKLLGLLYENSGTIPQPIRKKDEVLAALLVSLVYV
jgi:hypothetical protein